MQEAQYQRLRNLHWKNSARLRRPAVAAKIAATLGWNPATITFCDYDETQSVLSTYQKITSGLAEQEVQSRDIAIERIIREFKGQERNVALLEDGFDSCGVIAIPLSQILANLDGILSGQNEILRFVSWDGTLGVCLYSQEGTAPHFPRFIQVWNDLTVPFHEPPI